MIISTCYNSFENGYPLRVIDLFQTVSFHIKSDGFTINYLTKYLINHPQFFQFYETEVLEKSRCEFDMERLENYFNNVRNAFHLISSRLICNIDEIGFGEIHSAGKVHVIGKPNVDSKMLPKYKILPSIKRITALIPIFLDGTSTSSLIIVPTKTIQKDAAEKMSLFFNGIVRYQPNGYITTE